MNKECNYLYRRLTNIADYYSKGLVSKNDLTNELSYFIMYSLDKTLNPYMNKIENNLERVLLNER